MPEASVIDETPQVSGELLANLHACRPPRVAAGFFCCHDLPRKQRAGGILAERSVGLRQNPITRHRREKLPPLLSPQHRRADREPAPASLRAFELPGTAAEPMQDGDACVGVAFQHVEHLVSGAAAVDGHHAPSSSRTGRKDALEAPGLDVEMVTVLGSAVEPDFTNVTRLHEQGLKERKLGMALVGQLWVQAQCCPNPGRALRQFERATPSLGYRRDGEDMVPAGTAPRGARARIRVEIQVTVEVDQTPMPDAVRKPFNSARPRLTTSS